MEELKSTGNPAIHYSRINFGFHKQPTKKDVPSAIFEISSPLEPNIFFFFIKITHFEQIQGANVPSEQRLTILVRKNKRRKA
jgi:hypothetical protein